MSLQRAIPDSTLAWLSQDQNQLMKQSNQGRVTGQFSALLLGAPYPPAGTSPLASSSGPSLGSGQGLKGAFPPMY